AKFRLKVMNELRTRGDADNLIPVVDGQIGYRPQGATPRGGQSSKPIDKLVGERVVSARIGVAGIIQQRERRSRAALRG
ncbi:MAG: hypothetical protein OXU81_10610, partial [Gammaproteobacteria bacterium]|nr:hypothetical protein [Gammaproteobacteria bacterium]